jgi:hypothetical protein
MEKDFGPQTLRKISATNLADMLTTGNAGFLTNTIVWDVMNNSSVHEYILYILREL